MSIKKAELLLSLTAIFWGMGYIGADILLQSGMSPVGIVGSKFLIASIFLVVLFRKKLKYNKLSILASLYIGAILYFAFVFQTTAMEYTSTTNVSFFTGINVVFVPILLYIVFKEKIKLKNVLAVTLTIFGIYLLTGKFNEFHFGDFLAIICSFFYAVHILLISYYSKKCDIYQIAIGQMIVVTILSFLTFPLLNINIVTEISNINIWVLLFVGIVPTAICFLMQNIGLKYIDESRGSIILATESLWGAVFAIIFLGEPFTLLILIGGFVMYSAVLLDEI